MIIWADAQALKGVNSHILNIFRNEGLERIGEAETIEDKNQEHQNSSKDPQAAELGRLRGPTIVGSSEAIA